MATGRSQGFALGAGVGFSLLALLCLAPGGCTGPGLEPPFGSDRAATGSGGALVTGTGGASNTTGGTAMPVGSGGSAAAGGVASTGGSTLSGGEQVTPGADAGVADDMDSSMPSDAAVDDAATTNP